MLALKRMRRRAGLFLAFFAVVLLLAGLSVGLSGYVAAAAAAGARAGVSALTGADGGFDVSIPWAADASAQAAQDARVRATVRTIVRVDGRAVPMVIDRDIVTANEVELDRSAGASVRSALASIPGLSDRAKLVAGRWPTARDEASMQANAASTLGVHLGELLTMPGGSSVTITATWRVQDPKDPRWLDDSISLRGIDPDVYSTHGWVVIDPALWGAITVDPVARWTIRPVADRITVAQLPALQRAPDAVSGALQKAEPGQDVQEAGLLQLALRPIQQNVESAGAVSTAPLVVVAVLGIITLIELARMLDQLRTAENALVRARGESRRRFVLEAAAEGAVAAVPGAVLGSALAASLLSGAAADIPPIGWAGAAACAVITVVALSLVAARSSRDVRPAPATRASGLGRGVRFRSTVGVGAIVILVLLAVVAVSQFLLYESPLTPVAGGGVAVDPLSVSAIALAIAAVGVVALAAFPLVGRALERWSRRANNLDSLPLQQLARRSRAELTPILVMAFAVSSLILAATYSGTWSTSSSETRAVQIGASLRVTAPAQLGASITHPVAGQTATAPVARDDVLLGESLVTMIAMPASRLAAAVATVPGAVDPAALAARLRSKVSLPQLPASATGLSLRLIATPASAVPTSAEVTLVDAAGAENLVQLAPGATGDEFTATLPSGLAPWTVHAIDVLLPEVTAGTTVEISLRSTGTAADLRLDGSWVPSWGDASSPGIDGLGGGRAGIRVDLAGPGGHVLLQSLRGGAARLPIVISRKVALDTGLSVGSMASMVLVTRHGTIPVTVAGISTVIPGIESGAGVLVDLGSLQDAADGRGLAHVSAGEWWVATTAPASAADEMQRRAPVGAVVETAASTPADQVLESARVVVWVAGIATALLALLTVGAGLLAELRGRRDEVGVLRAVGVAPRPQSRGRVIEWMLLLALGLVAGLIDGVLVCALLVPDLARAAIPNAMAELRTYLAVDVPGGALAAAAVFAALAGLLVAILRTVRKQAR